MHRAIETHYAGRRFRSRLEARWAVLFTSLGILWDYEPEGFELGGGLRYLPDFAIYTRPLGHEHREKRWVEIKPEPLTWLEERKLALLAQQTHCWAAALIGPTQDARARQICPGDDAWLGYPTEAWTTLETFADCCPDYSMRLEQQAIDAALSARFEFGENGARA